MSERYNSVCTVQVLVLYKCPYGTILSCGKVCYFFFHDPSFTCLVGDGPTVLVLSVNYYLPWSSPGCIVSSVSWLHRWLLVDLTDVTCYHRFGSTHNLDSLALMDDWLDKRARWRSLGRFWLGIWFLIYLHVFSFSCGFIRSLSWHSAWFDLSSMQLRTTIQTFIDVSSPFFTLIDVIFLTDYRRNCFAHYRTSTSRILDFFLSRFKLRHVNTEACCRRKFSEIFFKNI